MNQYTIIIEGTLHSFPPPVLLRGFTYQKKCSLKSHIGIILLEELFTCGKLIWHLTKNKDKGVANAHNITSRGKIQILKFQIVKFKNFQT